jgi:CRP-like cAMP-binding protein
MISPEKLRRLPLLAGVPYAILKDLAIASEEIALKKGDWLFYEGEKANSLYIILSGALRLKIALDPEGACHVDLDTLAKDAVVGWSAVVEPHIYGLSAVATKDTRLAKLDGARLRGLMAQNPEAGCLLMSRLTRIVAGRLADVHVRFASLIEGGQWQRMGGRQTSRRTEKEQITSLN